MRACANVPANRNYCKHIEILHLCIGLLHDIAFRITKLLIVNCCPQFRFVVLVLAPRVYYVAINICSDAQRLRSCSCDMTWLLLLVSYPSPICVFIPEQHDMMRGMIHSCNMSLDTGADIVESWKYILCSLN